jgi:serine/threonine protein kinase
VNDPSSGRSVGRYRIVGFLGSGAMGEVYLAEDPHIERKLAIKTVRLVGRPQEIEDRKKRLLREARAAGRLLHPNVVTLFDAGETEGQLYLAFEFVEGADLASKLESGYRPSLREVLRFARQTADALHYAHAQGIVHRDIKPSNILVDTAGRVKVADFGIAKMTGQSTELTVAGSVMGSPQYLSPEQIRGDDLDGRTDIFSLGVVLYELLSGRRPFDGDTITTLVYQILHKDPPPISELRTVPPQLEDLLRRMLAKERDERIAPAGRVAEELAAIERDLSDETLSAPAVAAEPLEQTYVLPRSTATPPAQRLPPPPPPPPMPAATVPRPVSLPTASAPSQAPQAPPPPPPPHGGAAVAPQRRSSLWVPVALLLLLVAVLAAGGWLVLRKPEPEAVSSSEETPSDAGLETDAAPQTVLEEGTGEPVAVEAVGEDAEPEPTPEERLEEIARPTPAVPRPTPQPVPDQPLPRRGPILTPTPAPAAPVPTPEPAAPREEPRPEPVDEAPARRETPQADRTVRTGLEVAFRVTPPGAFLLLGRTPIGRAEEWSGQRGNRTYTLPGPGQHLIRVRKDGMREQRILLEASATGGTTPIFVTLQPLPAADVATEDLRQIRVREAVAFRVRPPGAMILVDDQPAGLASRYSGGIGRPNSWLSLPAGRHRVSVRAPGLRQQDFLVEVTPGAEKERERIEVVLTPE